MPHTHPAGATEWQAAVNRGIELQASILEAFIPGYSIISSFLLEVLGFDITIVVSICLLTFALVTSIKYVWNHVPIDTVVLERDQKDSVIADMNEYPHPASSRWYANRGIPYRRGYLFHGPPGTGKTSLSFAIAGVFGLDIHCVSLLEATLTEEDLGLLFNSLPRRCVVLLEDIDSAGLIRHEEPTDDIHTGSKGKIEPTTQISVEIAKAFRIVQEKNDKNLSRNQGISLSGLLNAIDGVASHEGRVLVMTTLSFAPAESI
ncbi:MAG: hypothetical protein Q9187_000983 [Circinaria calcarea]